MSAPLPKKRSLEPPDEATVNKRSREEEEESTTHTQHEHAATTSILASLSVESMLAVPLEFIFHQAPGARSKPLLTRAEAQCFISVTLLAHELDSLTDLTATVLEQRHAYQGFATKLQSRNKNPRLLPFLILLNVASQQLPDQSLEKIRTDLEHVLSELRLASANLRQHSEQNWTLSESLLDAGPDGERVAIEKRKLSDIQDELSVRISTLLKEDTEVVQENACASASTVFPPTETMEQYCERIMSRVEDPVEMSQHSLSQSQRSGGVKNQSQGSTRSEHLKSPPVKSDAGKENDPSSQQGSSQQSLQQPSEPQASRSSVTFDNEYAAADDDGRDSPMSSSDDDSTSNNRMIRRYGGETQDAAVTLSAFMSIRARDELSQTSYDAYSE